MTGTETAPVAGSGPEDPRHSMAFEAFVEKPNDTLGLLAYALYKQVVHQDARKGIFRDKFKRSPGEHEVRIYKDAAWGMLEEFGNSMVKDATPDIQETKVSQELATVNANIATLQTNIVATIQGATGLGKSVWSNILAWLAISTLIIIIVVITKLPDAYSYIANWARNLNI